MKDQLIEKVLKPIEAAGFKAYFVGGCVRDRLMGKELSRTILNVIRTARNPTSC